MENLYKETLEALARYGKTPRDAEWVGDGDEWVTWDRFAELAKDLNYDSGYGIQNINPGLVVRGKDWWLARMEYDGSEWWQLFEPPVKPGSQSDPDLHTFPGADADPDDAEEDEDDEDTQATDSIYL
jgi:hypothetical protein